MGVIFVAGIYGVGKSTLCARLSKELGVPAYSAGDLISAVNEERYGANKAVNDKCLNQNILALQVNNLLKATPKILLAGHFCIFDKNNNVDYLPETVFSDLEITEIILLETSISRIIEILSVRDNKEYTKQQVSALQSAESQRAQVISLRLGCKLYLHTMSFDDTDILKCLSYVKTEEKL